MTGAFVDVTVAVSKQQASFRIIVSVAVHILLVCSVLPPKHPLFVSWARIS